MVQGRQGSGSAHAVPACVSCACEAQSCFRGALMVTGGAQPSACGAFVRADADFRLDGWMVLMFVGTTAVASPRGERVLSLWVACGMDASDGDELLLALNLRVQRPSIHAVW